MTALDDRLRPTADKLVSTFGKGATLRRRAISIDPNTGGSTTSTVDHAVTISPPSAFKSGLVDGSTVKAGDLQALLAALNAPVTPETVTDTVIIDAVSYTLVQVDPIFSGEQVAVYRLHLRR